MTRIERAVASVRASSLLNPARLLSLLFALAFADSAAADVLPPPASTCVPAASEIAPGSTPTQPGTWWNPNRYGTSWGLTYQENDSELTVVWYTYDSAGRPTWLMAGPATIAPDKTWTAPLVRRSWSWGASAAGASTAVGSVAFRFYDNDPTAAAIRWQWNGVNASAYDECIRDFARPSNSSAPQPFGVNTAFNGFWFEPGLPGYGLSLQMQQNTDVSPVTYSEAFGLTIFDDAGSPVWLLAKAPDVATAPSIATARALTIDYSRSGAGYGGSAPISNCNESSGNCIVTHPAVGTLTRTFSSANAGTASLVMSADQIGSNALPASFPVVTLFDRPATGTTPVTIIKSTAVTQVLVDRTQCVVPPGSTSCIVTINWAIAPDVTSPSVVELDLVTAVATQVSTARHGESARSLASGRRVQYQVRQGTTVLHSSPEVSALGDPIENVPDAPLTPASVLSAALGTHTATVGATPGSASVQGGAASYVVPIEVPPGRNGMEPSLSLTYDSRGGNGVAGMGWSLSGQSSIHRCPQTVAQDGSSRAVKFDLSDKLCLDGERLIAVSGTYGAENAVYATEIDSFVRITQRGGALNATDVYFELAHKDGDISWYGGVRLSSTCGSNCDPQSGAGLAASTPRVLPATASGAVQTAVALSWPIERRVDRFGNMIRYVYTNFGRGELLLREVIYSGKQSDQPSSVDGNRRVEITYVSRPVSAGANDVSTTYMAGYQLQQAKRIDRVVTHAGSEKVREYQLGYVQSAGTGRSLLESVTECATTPTTALQCRESTVLSWNHAANNYTLIEDPRINGIAGLPLGEQGDFSSSVRFSGAGDFNGDGSREVLWIGPTSSTDATPEQRLLTLSADRSIAKSLTIPAEQVGSYGGTHTDLTGRADFNLDGRADIITLPQPTAGSSTRKIVLKYWLGPQDAATFSAAFTNTAQGGSATLDTGIVVDDLRSIKFVGDMNGDGRPDIVTERNNPSGGAACSVKVSTYLNLPGATSASPISFSGAFDNCLTGVTNPNGGYYSESLSKVADINGDGLPDLWIDAATVSTDGFSRVQAPVWTRASDTVWTVAWTGSSAETYFTNGRTSQERSKSLFSVWLDANGDGLEDWAYAEALSSTSARWQLRYGVGVGFGPQATIGVSSVPINVGIERCDTNLPGNTCGTAWSPYRAGLIRVMDTDSDGRDEILIPRAFAARVCSLHVAETGPDCPVPNIADTIAGHENALAGQPSATPGDRCSTFYYCPEHPVTGDEVPPGISLRFDTSGDGLLEPSPFTPPENVRPIYANGADGWDRSTYLMTAIKFVENGLGGVTLHRTDTDITSNENSGWSADDIYGDGLVDAPIKTACFDDIGLGARRRCGVPYRYANGTALPAADYPQSLPGGLPVLSRKALLNENRGPGGVLLSDTKTPATPDVMTGAQDGLGVVTTWGYYPLSSKAGRPADQLPLYKLNSLSAEYVDSKHIYFTSSMPVVATMTSSNGIGGVRSWRYGYESAMYHQQGRGFQGFRTVTEDDVTGKQRLRSEFHQKFPLAGRPSATVRSFLLGNTPSIVQSVNYTWLCDRGNRNNVSGAGSCEAFQPGAGKFPFADTVVTLDYDPTVSEMGGPATLLTRRDVFNSPGSLSDSCVFSSAGSVSGIDVYGNVTATSEVTQESSQFVQMSRHCAQATSVFLPNADPQVWWVDKLASRIVSSRATYGAGHGVPAGVSNLVQRVYSAYSWNLDRSLEWERVSETEVPTGTTSSPVRTKRFEYDVHGSPTMVREDSNTRALNGTYFLAQFRKTVTAYTADGYFPQTVSRYKNASSAHLTSYSNIRARDGQPGMITDPNGLKTRLSYDSFGFMTKTEYLDSTGAIARMPFMQRALAACAGCAPDSVYKISQVQDGAPKQVKYFDLLGQTVREENQLLDGGISKVDTSYDELGRLNVRSAPYRETESPQYTFFVGYDLAGRLTAVYEPRNLTDAFGNNDGDLGTAFTYAGRSTETAACGTSNSASCRYTSKTTDLLGRVLTSTDAAGQATGTWYDGAGNVIALRGVDSAVTSATYDAFGHRTQVNDPNQGVWNFSYSGLGELEWQQDARGVVTTFSSDWLGRRVGRSTAAHAKPTSELDTTLDTVVDSYHWDAANGIGLPVSHFRTINGVTERAQTIVYDQYARPAEVHSAQDTDGSGLAGYMHRNVYDQNFGRLKAEVWPNLASRHVIYSASGYPSEDRSPVDGTVHRKILAVDGRGQVKQETIGALTATRTYAPTTGQMLSFSYKAGSVVRRAQEYRYDLFGNLSSRKLDPNVAGITATTETFSNDVLDRVLSSTRSGGATGSVSYGYHPNGNFRTKSDYSVSDGYAYGVVGKSAGGNAGPHAVRQVQRSAEGGNGSVNFTYDNNGNLTAITDPSVPFAAVYDSSNLPTYTKRGAAITRLTYGADDQRARQWGADGFHIYLDRFEDIRASGGTAPVESRAYLGDYAIFSRAANGTTAIEYLLVDRLGSVDAVATPAGTVSEKRGHDAFGAPRSGTSWANTAPKRLASIAATGRGYTAHEHLNSVELIHMNGRAYDYKVGRFLSVDPLIQFPADGQSHNPYSYVRNNPQGSIDPSGFCETSVGSRIKDCANLTAVGSDGAKKSLGKVNLRNAGQVKHAVFSAHSMFNGRARQHSEGAARRDRTSSGASDVGSVTKNEAASRVPDSIEPLSGENFVVGSNNQDGADPVSVPSSIKIEKSGYKAKNAALKGAASDLGPTGVANKQELQVGIIRVASGNWGYLTPGWGPVGSTEVDATALFDAYVANNLRPNAWLHGHFDSQLNFSAVDFAGPWEGIELHLVNRRGEVRVLNRSHLDTARRRMKGTIMGSDLGALQHVYQDVGLPGDEI